MHVHHEHNQDFSKGGSHCVKQRVLTKLSFLTSCCVIFSVTKKGLQGEGRGGGGHAHPRTSPNDTLECMITHTVVESANQRGVKILRKKMARAAQKSTPPHVVKSYYGKNFKKP